MSHFNTLATSPKGLRSLPFTLLYIKVSHKVTSQVTAVHQASSSSSQTSFPSALKLSWVYPHNRKNPKVSCRKQNNNAVMLHYGIITAITSLIHQAHGVLKVLLCVGPMQPHLVQARVTRTPIASHTYHGLLDGLRRLASEVKRLEVVGCVDVVFE
jgi:hypothetical protein